ncbi:shikimate dehydrogenase [Flavobacterium sp. HSC-61S13]|uniref:shikimate dehydrogenase family protein n=1 Tax=Flavobacterium sp. HSC-61S13 TaxID=2910963 RepID=UPI0020A2154F|nr:shikimate dehydrogenase [Flavobacterium sp. HSC-61S13]MCP1997222.1 shikimate dehydrogenase [Flavobacterium sp. HSC-61S13]
MGKRNQYGLIGKNIEYSFSRQYFKRRFTTKGDQQSTYENFELNEISEFTKILADNPNLKGLNVTIPYKESIIPYLDDLSTKVLEIGAVNTIRISKKGKLKGYNTDWYGFYKSLKPLLKNKPEKALILGTGGASKAVYYALQKLKIETQFVSRSPEEGVLSYQQLTPAIFKSHLLVINTTPLGTFPDIDQKPDIDYSLFSDQHLAYDLIYNPEISSFLREAQKRGAQIKNGLEMLELQAEKSWSIWNKIVMS